MALDESHAEAARAAAARACRPWPTRARSERRDPSATSVTSRPAAASTSATPAPLRWPSKSSTTTGPSASAAPASTSAAGVEPASAVGAAPVATTTSAGRAPGAFVRVGLDAELDLDPESLELAHAPVDQLRERGLEREACDQAHLASGRLVALEHGHAMAALGRHPRGLEAGEARPDHEHALRARARAAGRRAHARCPRPGSARTRSETCAAGARCTGCSRCTRGCARSRRRARAPARAGRRSARASSRPGRRRRRRAPAQRSRAG